MGFTLDKNTVVALSNGSFNNPFSVLGLHDIEYKGKKRLIIRVFRPEAKEIHINVGKSKPFALNRVSAEGLFEAIVPRRKNRFKYTMTIIPHHGEPFELADTYTFGSALNAFDLQLWGEGNHQNAYSFMGAHIKEMDGVKGTHFVVSAPAAERVSVIGSFNNWDGRVHGMRLVHRQGLWELFIPHIAEGDLYKFEIKSTVEGKILIKSDPYGYQMELRPGTASIVANLEGFDWEDEDWVNKRKENQALDKPISVYEVHAGSWKKKTDHTNRFLNYRELADELIPYVKDLGFTHIELMPIAEHPYDPSWGYQITGYYAPTSRYGKPKDFMYFVNECHKAGIGVIMDWVPAHFAKDGHGLSRFDGTGLYEHEDPRQGEHKDWGTYIFNYGRVEVQNFLVSNAVYWIDKYHIDGLRVDAVASMLYLDYSREEGEWVPNKYGGRENLEAIDFLRKFNNAVHNQHPGVITFAEESTSWGGVSRSTESGGLGFDYKWNMGWMNDTLDYIKDDPIYRKYHQNKLTFSLVYAFSENFILPFSHDEVVHLKKSLLSKMPGDDWQKFANLRLLYTYMFTHPGKNLIFMGSEFGQWGEWNQDHPLDWHLLDWDNHKGLKRLVRDLNILNKNEEALHQLDSDWQGFEWIDVSDADNSIISYIRKAKNSDNFLVIILNFTPNVHYNYKFGVPKAGEYIALMNSDSKHYGGSNAGDTLVKAKQGNWHNQPANIELTIPPLAGVILKLKN